MLIKIYLIGLAILITAILANWLASFLGIETWYSFLIEVNKSGLTATLKSKWASLIFLLIIYPSLLGLSAFLVYINISNQNTEK